MKIIKLNENAKIPTTNPTDAGFDLYADADFFIPIYETAIITTGIAIELPRGTFGKIEDRSSVASYGLRTGGGVVDEGYRGEIKIIMHNVTNATVYNEDRDVFGYAVKKGEKIAQLVVLEYIKPDIVEVKSMDDFKKTDRGTDGFGSTGRF